MNKRNTKPSLNACQVPYFLMDVPIYPIFLIKIMSLFKDIPIYTRWEIGPVSQKKVIEDKNRGPSVRFH